MHLIKIVTSITGLFFLFNFHLSGLAQKTTPAKGIKVITPERIKTHIDFLASDALLGRNTPSAGLDTAAAYIVREFKKDGLQSVNGSYLDSVPLITIGLGDDNLLEIRNHGEVKTLLIKSQFIPFENTASGCVEGSLVFAGYGITAPQYNYDDYSGMNVTDKIVVVLRHIPNETDSASVFKGKNPDYGSLSYKMENALKHGAIGVLVVTDPLNHLMLNPRGFPWPSLYKSFPKDALPLVLKDSQKQQLPLIHVGKEIAETLFGSMDSLKSIQVNINKKLKPLSREFPDIDIKLKVSTIETPVKSCNVLGFMPGTDQKLKNEILVIGAHYDHVGFMKQHKEGENYIFNGADDNASGTSGLLAVAEAFAKAKTKRSILFIAFSAEEKGLFGSRAYVQDPLFPLKNTVAMINMDMIGRGHPDTLHLEAGALSPDLTKIAQEENKEVKFKIQVDGMEFLDRSDQSSFYHKNIPFIMFFAGLHNDYHTVRDKPNTIDTVKASRIATLAYKTAWRIVNDNKHYQLIENK
ncbi:MAG TPA: M20/M25/M40 family metallo-hydrolase [Bacteroidales bacterium]